MAGWTALRLFSQSEIAAIRKCSTIVAITIKKKEKKHTLSLIFIWLCNKNDLNLILCQGTRKTYLNNKDGSTVE